MFLPFLPLISGIVGFAAGYAIAAAVEYLNGPKIKALQAKKKLGKAIKCVAKKVGRVTFKDLDSGECSDCLLYTSPSPRDPKTSRMPSSA